MWLTINDRLTLSQKKASLLRLPASELASLASREPCFRWIGLSCFANLMFPKVWVQSTAIEDLA